MRTEIWQHKVTGKLIAVKLEDDDSIYDLLIVSGEKAERILAGEEWDGLATTHETMRLAASIDNYSKRGGA